MNRLELPAGAEEAVASDKADLPTWLIGEGNGEAPIINLGAPQDNGIHQRATRSHTTFRSEGSWRR
jgi:hypothetical protein